MANREFNNLIFLGAGASQAEIDYLKLKDTSILQGQLLRSYFSTADEGNRLDLLQTFFRIFFNIDTSDPSVEYPTFEETLALIEQAINKDENLGVKLSFQQVRTQLVYAIAHTLASSLEEVGENSLHNSLLAKLDDAKQLDDTAFVSLNYDIIVDNAILSYKGKDNRLLFPDYGFFLAKEKQRFKFKGTAVPLYKLHGSLNWLFCPVCCSIQHIGTEKIDSNLAEEPGYMCDTQGCDEYQVPVLIPPTYLKDISNPFLHGTWNRAQNVLKNVSRIYFCGYSLPDADFQVKYLLKSLQMERSTNRAMEVYVASNAPDGTNSTFTNYSRFFGAETAIDLKMNFREFVSEIDFSK